MPEITYYTIGDEAFDALPDSALQTYSLFRQKIGNRFANYEQYIREGRPLPALPYHIRYTRWYDNVGLCDYYNTYYRRWYFSYVWKNALGIMGGITYDHNTAEAEGKALESLFSNADRYSSQIGVTVAELPKTIDLIGHTAVRLAKSFGHLKRLNVVGAFRELGVQSNTKHFHELRRKARSTRSSVRSKADFASNAWLELQYGWKPLLSDIDSAAEDLASAWEKDPSDIIVRGSGRSKGSAKPNITIDGSFSANITTRVGYNCYARVIDSNLRTRSGLGLANLSEVAWELVPFSFVVDWLVPIGPFLSALNATEGLTFTSGSKTVKTSVSVSALVKSSVNYVPEHALAYDYTHKQFDRTTISDFPSASEVLRVKNLNEVFSTSHTLSALALLNNIFK